VGRDREGRRADRPLQQLDHQHDQGRGQPRRPAGDRRRVYVATGNNKISRVDAQSGAVAAPIPVGTSAAYYTVGAGSLWVSYPVDNVVRSVDLDTRKKVGDVKLSFNLRAGPRVGA
jgi:hypothetical protein